MDIITTHGLTKKYKDMIALNHVNLHVEKGGIYGFVGKNGAGKTTFFKLLMGLSQKSAGSIQINEMPNLNKARSQIGFMIGPSFFPYMTPKQNIEYYRKLKGIKDKQETTRVLKMVGLYEVDKPFKSFSMGMKQRLGIANALLGNPPIVILDEPLNGLDPQGISDIREMILSINQQKGTTFIISSHILSELDLIATRFGFIDHGILLKETSHQELHELTRKSLYLEVDNPHLAIEILEKQLQTCQYIKSSHQGIILNDYLTEPDRVAKALVEGGVKLYELKRQETTLEEYFINLVGGNQDA